jgi:flagellar M-ring protein FliF
LKTQLGTMINALAFITVAVLLIMFGFRPLLGPAARQGFGPGGAGQWMMAWNCRTSPRPPGRRGAMPMEGFGADFGFGEDERFRTRARRQSGTFNRRVKEGPERRLARMVEINEERAAKILRSWASSEAA